MDHDYKLALAYMNLIQLILLIDSVFCICVDPVTSTYAVTGGEDDAGYVWTVASGEVHLKCTGEQNLNPSSSGRKYTFISSFAGHKDSVTCVGFSHDSALVASADMGGLIKVWNMVSKAEVWSFELSDLEVGCLP